jgi:hypothetical protein
MDFLFGETARSPTPRRGELSPNTNVVLQQILLEGLKELTQTAEQKVLTKTEVASYSSDLHIAFLFVVIVRVVVG